MLSLDNAATAIWGTAALGTIAAILAAVIGSIVGSKLTAHAARDEEAERQRTEKEDRRDERLGAIESRLAGIEAVLRLFHPELRHVKDEGL